jgi:hypothetical protein
MAPGAAGTAPSGRGVVSVPAAPRKFVSIGEGIGARAAHYVLEAYRVARSSEYRDHSICGYSCGCKQRPKGWPVRPPTHPRYEECHP